MPTITVFAAEDMPKLEEAISMLNGKGNEENWMSARQNKYNQDEIFVQHWYYEDVESGLKRAFSDEDSYEIVTVLKENGKDRVLKRTYAFINYVTHSLEIYRGLGSRTNELLKLLEKNLKTTFRPLVLSQDELVRIYKQHSTELRKATLRNQQSNEEITITGKNVDASETFTELLRYPWLLREISFRPKIKFVNEHNKYVVSLDGDKGTLKISSNQVFQWRPRYEIRQLIFAIAATKGMTNQAKTEAGMKVSALRVQRSFPSSSHNSGPMPTESQFQAFERVVRWEQGSHYATDMVN